LESLIAHTLHTARTRTKTKTTTHTITLAKIGNGDYLRANIIPWCILVQRPKTQASPKMNGTSARKETRGKRPIIATNKRGRGYQGGMFCIRST
jgi:hypothetical protein